MADRKLPTSTSTPPVTGATYLDAVAEKVGLLFDASAQRAASITNTGDDYTIEVDPALDADVVGGMSFYVQPTVTNGGPSRLRVHSGNPYYDLVRSDGSPLARGEFSAGTVYLIVFLAGQFMIVAGGSNDASTLIDYQVFVEAGTWTKPVGLDDDALVLVEAWGGGGGGGAPGGGAYQGGGGGGAYVWRWLRAGDLGATELVQVGGGGTASSNPGGTGGASSFGAHVVAHGGGGGFAVSGAAVTGGGGGGGGWGGSGGAGALDVNGGSGGLHSLLFGGGQGGGSSTSGAAGGYGGGGGGGLGKAGGASLFGGAGGAGGEAGAPRGGGGGGGAPGGRGEVVVRVIRPSSRAMAGALSIADGTAAEPGLSFGNDPDTGLMRIGDNEMSLVAGGVIGLRQSGWQSLFLGGSATAPAVASQGDKDTGIYFAGGDQIGIATAGVARICVDANGFIGFGTLTPGAELEINDAIGDQDVRINLRTGSALTQLGSSIGAAFVNIVGARPYIIYSDGAERVRVDTSGRLLVATSTGASLLTINGDTLQLMTPKTPASASAAGATGQIAWDASHIYVCTAPDTWVRAALATW